MMPLGDDNSGRKIVPVVTYAIIVLNILFFLLELAGGDTFVDTWAFQPARFLAHPAADAVTLFTSMFMHAGWGHLIGNMLYLWIFGDNVEDSFGSLKYLLFYVASGLGATFLQLFFFPTSTLPNLGASGAIAGVLGGYMYLYPQGKVRVLLGNTITAMPAIVVIGFWFLLQFFGGVGTLYATEETGGVAYMAHIGGFVMGFVLAVFFHATQKRSE